MMHETKACDPIKEKLEMTEQSVGSDGKRLEYIPIVIATIRSDGQCYKETIYKRLIMRGDSPGWVTSKFIVSALECSRKDGFACDSIDVSDLTLRNYLNTDNDEIANNGDDLYKNIKALYGRDVTINNDVPLNQIVLSSYLNPDLKITVTYKYLTKEEADAYAV